MAIGIIRFFELIFYYRDSRGAQSLALCLLTVSGFWVQIQGLSVLSLHVASVLVLVSLGALTSPMVGQIC